MKRLIRKPTFWVTLIVGSFVLNSILAIVTLRDHWFYAHDLGRDHSHRPVAASHSLFLFPRPRGWRNNHNNNNHDNNNKKDYNHPTQILQTPDSVLWRRLLREEHTLTCGGGSRRMLPTNPESMDNNNTSLLPPFGFRQHIEQFLLESSPATNASDSTRTSSLRKQFTRPEEVVGVTAPTCYLPPTNCTGAGEEEQYSVVVYSQARNLRRLLLNIMSFQMYPSVGDVTLLLLSSSSSQDFLLTDQKDKYGQRLWKWNQTGTIRILLYQTAKDHNSSLWSALSTLHPNHQGVLFMDGDVKKHWNGTSLKTTFGAWKQHSRSLLVVGDDTRAATTSPSRVPESTTESYFSCPLNQLHGTMIHRNWLCFLNHPLLRPIQQYLTQTPTSSTSTLSSPHQDQEILNGLAIVWNQLGDGHILASDDINPHLPQLLLPSSSRNDRQQNTSTIRTAAFHETSKDDQTRQLVQQQQQQEQKMSTILNYFGCSCSVDILSTLDLTTKIQ